MLWMGLTAAQFYNQKFVAFLPMGFCYPGTGKSGDLPPRKECAPEWHQRVMAYMPQLVLILLVGKYAQDYYLDKPEKNLTETVRNFHSYLPTFLPIPHPSPRNNIWQKKNPWFEVEVLPVLKEIINKINKE